MKNNQSLSGLRILITNDDGINSHGIKALERIANSITPDVWIVAPEVGQSGKGLSVTFDSALRIKELSPRKFSVSGTPADCIFLAVGEILKDKEPDLILSGINHGANVADFIGLSGTIGATFAAASRNIRSIAISQECKKAHELLKFPLADHFLSNIIKKLLSFKWPDRVCMNVNFPEAQVGDISGVKIASQGDIDVKWAVYKRLDPTDEAYYWLHAVFSDAESSSMSDVKIIAEGKYITISALKNKQEYCGCNDKLEELFATNGKNKNDKLDDLFVTNGKNKEELFASNG
ncbi:MAG: 5'/3'-nucleotidase SurE [Holosporaceae bacterium]|nr:5'/3'-nucleotidase SurE [Holosporaceae bacterium]